MKNKKFKIEKVYISNKDLNKRKDSLRILSETKRDNIKDEHKKL